MESRALAEQNSAEPAAAGVVVVGVAVNTVVEGSRTVGNAAMEVEHPRQSCTPSCGDPSKSAAGKLALEIIIPLLGPLWSHNYHIPLASCRSLLLFNSENGHRPIHPRIHAYLWKQMHR